MSFLRYECAFYSFERATDYSDVVTCLELGFGGCEVFYALSLHGFDGYAEGGHFVVGNDGIGIGTGTMIELYESEVGLDGL